jgi:hypothetical protein
MWWRRSTTGSCPPPASAGSACGDQGRPAPGQPSGVAVRKGRAGDLDRILNLLTQYRRPRSYFEPWYLADPSYQPAQSWLAERTASWWRFCGSTRVSCASAGRTCAWPVSAT